MLLTKGDFSKVRSKPLYFQDLYFLKIKLVDYNSFCTLNVDSLLPHFARGHACRQAWQFCMNRGLSLAGRNESRQENLAVKGLRCATPAVKGLKRDAIARKTMNWLSNIATHNVTWVW